jgi:hypothetical protein
MPARELKEPRQVVRWLEQWGAKISEPAGLILIGSGGLLWHAHARGIEASLPENSMDVDPITSDESVALLAYDALIGSQFEKDNGWHVNLMPNAVLSELPVGWEDRASKATYGHLNVTIPSPADLIAPKLRRGEPRDLKHAAWAKQWNLIES